MSKAFLSHSSQQKSLVRKVFSLLGNSKAVLDEVDFESGRNLLEEIKSHIDNSDLAVIFISDDALNSSWVRIELDYIKSLSSNTDRLNILPIIVDKSIDISKDARIPTWLKSFLLKPITNPNIIAQKIKSRIREIKISKNEKFRLKNNYFVGRNSLFDKFEGELFNLDDKKSTSAIISGSIGSGRRTFLQQCLIRFNLINRDTLPIYIELENQDSIEDFILFLRSLSDQNIVESLAEVNSMQLEEKVEEAIKLIVGIKTFREHICIIDNGCIVKISGEVADWFTKIVSDSRLYGAFVLNVVSRFRIKRRNFWDKFNSIIHIDMPLFNDRDIQKLFSVYCRILEIELDFEQKKEVLSLMNGTPLNIYHISAYIAMEGYPNFIRNKRDVILHADEQAITTVQSIKDISPLAFDMTVLIGSFEFISYNMLYDIIGDNDETNYTLERLYVIGVYDEMGGNREFIKLNYNLRDYITRSKFRLNENYRRISKEIMDKFIIAGDDDDVFSDISELLFHVKSTLLRGGNIDKRLYMPSFVLKTVTTAYTRGNFQIVVKLLDDLLGTESRLSKDLVRESRYWLCLSLARLKEDRVFEEIKKFDKGVDSKFLYAFAQRYKGRFKEAQRSLEEILKVNSSFQKARREYVTVLLSQNEYGAAFEYAKLNYMDRPSNPFHAHAYFNCLIRRRGDKLLYKDELLLIIANLKKDSSTRAREMREVMEGQYDYYVSRKSDRAISKLEECATIHRNRNYAKRALKSIYKDMEAIARYNSVKISNLDWEAEIE